MSKSIAIFATLGVGLLLAGDVSAQVKGPKMEYPPRDAERPLAWGLLGKYVAEKSPLGDPVAEASKALVASYAVPFRPAPAAYTRIVTIDPFANRHLLRVPAVVPEETGPPLILPKR